MLQKLLLIALAGGLGTLARYGLTGLVGNLVGKEDFPWGTLAVNIFGCFLFGILWETMTKGTVSSEMRIVILVGFMGAFTTFSTYMYETGKFLQDAQWLAALGYVAGQNVVGFVALSVGILIGRAV